MSINTIFSPNKGYYIPNPSKDSPHEAHVLTKQLVTNGFDQLNWNNVIDSDDDTLDQDNIEDQDSDSIPYEKHSSNSNFVDKTGFAQSLLTNPVQNNTLKDDNDNDDKEDDGTKNKKTKKSKKMNKDERKEARRLKAENKKNKKDKSNGGDKQQTHQHVGSDSNAKIQLLKDLLRQVDKCENSKVLKFYDITVYKEDLFNLLDDEWLNDNNIGFVYEYLTRFQITPILKQRMKYASNEQINNSVTLLMPTFSFLLANHPNPKELKGVMPPMENSSFIFLPVNDNEDLDVAEGGSHWSLLLCCPKDRKVFVYDSMFLANERESLDLVKKLEIYFDTKFEVYVDKYTPQQINGSDCGISVAANTAVLLSRILNVEDNTKIDLSLKHVVMSAIDARIFVLGTLVNLIKDKDGRDL